MCIRDSSNSVHTHERVKRKVFTVSTIPRQKPMSTITVTHKQITQVYKTIHPPQ